MLRFLEWRFLGAPARGHRAPTPWYLTQRDRYAHNPGALLSAEYVDPELYFDPVVAVPDPSAGCDVAPAAALAATASEAMSAVEPSPWEEGLATGYWERVLPQPQP